MDAFESLTLGEIESERLGGACACVSVRVRACVFVSIVKDKLSCHFHNPQVSVSSFNLTFLRLETFIAPAINSLSHFFDKSFFSFFLSSSSKLGLGVRLFQKDVVHKSILQPAP